MRPVPFTPSSLAERWQCSERHIRNMIDSGKLPAFRLAGKLWRIRAEDVEEFECQSGASQNSGESFASPGMTDQSADVISLEQPIRQKRAAALQLTWDRVDFARQMVQLRNPFDKERRKGRATVPINDKLAAALHEAHKGALSPYVIEWAGGPVKSIKKGIKTAGEKIGRPDASPHMLRHSAAVWMVEDGHSIEEVAQFLGHENSHVTFKVYARFSPGHLRKLAKSLEI